MKDSNGESELRKNLSLGLKDCLLVLSTSAEMAVIERVVLVLVVITTKSNNDSHNSSLWSFCQNANSNNLLMLNKLLFHKNVNISLNICRIWVNTTAFLARNAIIMTPVQRKAIKSLKILLERTNAVESLCIRLSESMQNCEEDEMQLLLSMSINQIMKFNPSSVNVVASVGGIGIFLILLASEKKGIFINKSKLYAAQNLILCFKKIEKKWTSEVLSFGGSIWLCNLAIESFQSKRYNLAFLVLCIIHNCISTTTSIGSEIAQHIDIHFLLSEVEAQLIPKLKAQIILILSALINNSDGVSLEIASAIRCSSILGYIVSLLSHTDCKVIESANQMIASLQIHSRKSDLVRSLVEQDCIWKLHCNLNAENELTVEYSSCVLEWCRRKMEIDNITLFLRTMKLSENEILRKNVGVGTILLCCFTKELINHVIKEGAIDSILSMLLSSTSVSTGVFILQAIISLMDKKLTRDDAKRQIVDFSPILNDSSNQNEKEIPILVGLDKSKMIIKKRYLVKWSKKISEEIALNSEVDLSAYSTLTIHTIISVLNLSPIQMTTKLKDLPIDSILETLEFGSNYEIPKLKYCAGNALCVPVAAGNLLIMKAAIIARHPKLILKSLECFAYKLKSNLLTKDEVSQIRPVLKDFFEELFLIK